MRVYVFLARSACCIQTAVFDIAGRGNCCMWRKVDAMTQRKMCGSMLEFVVLC
jgi:hypothetical protein